MRTAYGRLLQTPIGVCLTPRGPLPAILCSALCLAPIAACFHSFSDTGDPSVRAGDADIDATAGNGSHNDAGSLGRSTAYDATGATTSDGPEAEADAGAIADTGSADAMEDEGGFRPQCAVEGGSSLRPVFADGFESYSLGSLYADSGSPWTQAVIGRDALVSNQWPHSGSQDLMIDSFTTRSEVSYVALPFRGPPRSVKIELWLTPDGYLVYEDFAEFGLAAALSTYDLRPAVAIKAHNHSLFVVPDPRAPSTDGGAPGGVELFNTIPFASSLNGTLVPTYIRVEFDFCSDQIDAYFGAAPDASTHATSAFHGERSVNAFYIAGGLNKTYIDDIAIATDDAP